MTHVIIGAGLAGTAAALWLDAHGEPVTLVSGGLGGFALSTGFVDILGYGPERVDDPLAAMARVPASHPYAGFTATEVRDAVAWFAGLVGEYLLTGDPAHNVLLPTAMGGLRPTALYPPSCAAGIVEPGSTRSFLVVAFRQHKDFPAELAVGNLARSTEAAITARSVVLDLPARDGEGDSSALAYARAFDDPTWRRRLVTTLAPHVQPGETVLMPGFCGRDPRTWRSLAEELGAPVAEVPLPPPSVLGLRLQDRLQTLLRGSRVRVYSGAKIVGSVSASASFPESASVPFPESASVPFPEPASVPFPEPASVPFPEPASVPFPELVEGSPWAHSASPRQARGTSSAARGADPTPLSAVLARTAGHDTTIAGTQFLLAAGGFESGALTLDSHLYLHETVLGLPVAGWGDGEPTIPDAMAPQPLFLAGLRTDRAGVALDAAGRPAHPNVHAAGGNLAGAQRWHELSGEGIALASALRAAAHMQEAGHGPSR